MGIAQVAASSRQGVHKSKRVLSKGFRVPDLSGCDQDRSSRLLATDWSVAAEAFVGTRRVAVSYGCPKRREERRGPPILNIGKYMGTSRGDRLGEEN
jgi:hypothetical protein